MHAVPGLTAAGADEALAAELQADIDRLRQQRVDLTRATETNRLALAAAIQRRNEHIRSIADRLPTYVLAGRYQLTRQRINQIVAGATTTAGVLS